eukprot:1747910-Alexandrium_andersonii.AAC.1
MSRESLVPVQVPAAQVVEPIRQVPGGILEDPCHTPGGGVRGDVEHSGGVPVHAVGLLEVAMDLEEQ